MIPNLDKGQFRRFIERDKVQMVHKFSYWISAVIFLSIFLVLNLKAQGADEYTPWSADSFAIVHSVDFEDNSLGIYGSYPSEWEADWGETFYHWNGWDRTEIIQKGNTKCQKIIYPLGTVNGVNQGIDYEADIPGPDGDSVELYLSYDVMWKPGFEFVISGKTAGHMIVGEDWDGEHGGGPDYEEGGRFGLSWMDEDWLGTANLRFYFYHHDFDATYGGETQPWADPYDDYGRFYFYTDEEIWYNITIRMVCNTVNTAPEPGNLDGFAEGFINGRFVTRWDNLRMRNVDTIGINSIEVYSQFGGMDPMFATIRDEWQLTDNYYIWTYDKSVTSAPRYYERSEPGRILHIPQSWSNATLEYEGMPDDTLVADNEAPGIPQGLSASNITSNSIDIQWNASSDNIAVTGYNIYLNGTKFGTSAAISYSLSGIDPATVYTIEVAAYDAAGNESAKSDAIAVTTAEHSEEVTDDEAPKMPLALNAVDYTDTSIDIRWDESTDNFGVIGYYIYLNGTRIGSSADTFHSITELDASTGYIVAVTAYDEAGNESVQSDVIQFILEELGPRVYINPDNKNDALEDGSIEHPYDSWQDVDWMEDYKYLQKRGTIANESKITVLSNNVSMGAYGEGEQPVIWSTAEDHAISFFEKSNITIQKLHVVAENALSSLYFLGDLSDNITIRNSKFEGSVFGIRIIAGKNFTIKYNSFSGNSEAIFSYAGNTEVFYNIFQNNQDAVHINGKNSSAKIYNNVFYDNNTAVTTEYSDLTLLNNIYYLTKDFDKALNLVETKLVSDFNIYYPQKEDFVTFNGKDFHDLSELQMIENIDANSFTSDPLFVDAFNHNFDVALGSPVIDAGIYVGITTDLIGKIVPFGNSPDIGVIETNEIASYNPFVAQDEVDIPFRIYPNPTNGIFNVSIDIPEKQEANLSLQNINGVTVLEKQCSILDFNREHLFDISHLPNGIYILSVKMAKKIYSKRIAKSF